jgi:hypothetical protein
MDEFAASHWVDASASNENVVDAAWGETLGFAAGDRDFHSLG